MSEQELAWTDRIFVFGVCVAGVTVAFAAGVCVAVVLHSAP